MEDRDPNIVTSGLSRHVAEDGVRIKVLISKLEHDREWSLEVINSTGTSIVWDSLFSSDQFS
jgi:hypothetical protein